MPVPFHASYYTLLKAAVKGVSLGKDAICPGQDCGVRGELVFTESRVERSCVFLADNKSAVYKRKPIPLARCGVCHRRFRVLPEEILPRKSYSLPVIEKCCSLYSLGPNGLRKTVDRIKGVHPHFTTLHGWLGGLGERALDRGMKDRSWLQGLPTTAAIVAESAKRLRAGLVRKWQQRPDIPRCKYKSRRRRDQLQACARVFKAASLLFPETKEPLSAWEGWLVGQLHVAAWVFGSRAGSTAIQLPPAPRDRVDFRVRKAKTQRKEKNHGSRSPPGGLLAF